MEPDPQKFSQAVAYASRLLGNREYAEKSLFEKLVKKGFSPSVAQSTIDFLKNNNWLSDARFCQSFIRGKISRGQGLVRVVYELKQHGVQTSLIDSILDEMAICWQTVCDGVIDKKLRASVVINDWQGRQKIERFLRYRGFSNEEIRQSIDKYMKNLGVTSGEYDE